ncbi:hypothetical protein KCP73_02300 [Salmonella enterica subsp. enterica]|nr:hypothetical protein KCP73_02300 [Salmonella enterica subsp. enterica]
MVWSIVGAADGDKNAYRKHLRNVALTTGFINIALNAGAHFSEYRNLRILDAAADNFNRVRVSPRGYGRSPIRSC